MNNRICFGTLLGTLSGMISERVLVILGTKMGDGAMFQERGSRMNGYRPSIVNHALDETSRLYAAARNRARLRRVWSALTGRPHRLLDLAAVQARCDVRHRYQAGIHTVPIRQIRGSEGRSRDFDADFRPLRAHTKTRWSGVAGARWRGLALPPVTLIQIGGIYFVRDGHHRISVARAFGQPDIEAEVTIWQVSGPLPWERAASAHSLPGQEMGIKQLFRKVRDDSIGLREHLLLGLRALVAAARMRSRGQIAPQVGTGGA
jgi:hypothetical protein